MKAKRERIHTHQCVRCGGATEWRHEKKGCHEARTYLCVAHRGVRRPMKTVRRAVAEPAAAEA